MQRNLILYALLLVLVGAAIVAVLHVGSSLPASQGVVEMSIERVGAVTGQPSALDTLRDGLLAHLEQP